MDTVSVTESIVINPSINFQTHWDGYQILNIVSDSLEFETDYTLTILDEAQDMYGHYIDGDGDSNSGGNFVLHFRTGPADMIAPDIVSVLPPNVAQNVEILPIINIQFDELLNTEIDLSPYLFFERFQDHSEVPGEFAYYPVYGRSSICYFPDEGLYPTEVYVTRLFSGLMDQFTNMIEIKHSFSFQTGNMDIDMTETDDLEGNMADNWRDPHASGNTNGII
mgnify:CR=1 FL=1